MNIPRALLLSISLITTVACARVVDGNASDSARESPSPAADGLAQPQVGVEFAKLFESLRSVDDASPEAVSRHLGIDFSAPPTERQAKRWEGHSSCGTRSIEIFSDAQPPSRSVVLTLPTRSTENGEPTCCLLRLSDLSEVLGNLGYTRHLTDAIDRKRLWIFQARPDRGDARIHTLVFTRPESRSEAETGVCVNRIDIGIGPRS